MSFVALKICKNNMAVLGVVDSAFCRGCLPLRGSALWHRAIVGHVGGPLEALARPFGSGSFPLPREGYRMVLESPLPLPFFVLPFPRPGDTGDPEECGEACTRREVAIGESHYGKVSAAELDFVEALPSVQVRSVGRIKLFRLFSWVNIIQGLVVGSIVIKVLEGLVHVNR